MPCQAPEHHPALACVGGFNLNIDYQYPRMRARHSFLEIAASSNRVFTRAAIGIDNTGPVRVRDGYVAGRDLKIRADKTVFEVLGLRRNVRSSSLFGCDLPTGPERRAKRRCEPKTGPMEAPRSHTLRSYHRNPTAFRMIPSVRWSPSTEKVLSIATVTVAVADAANNGALSSVYAPGLS